MSPYLVLSGEAEIVFTSGKPEVVGTSRRGELLGKCPCFSTTRREARQASVHRKAWIAHASTQHLNRTGAESFPGRTVLQGLAYVVSTQSRSTLSISGVPSVNGEQDGIGSGCRSTWRHHSSLDISTGSVGFPKWGARYAMNWNTGSQHPGPHNLFASSGELLLVSSGGLILADAPGTKCCLPRPA